MLRTMLRIESSAPAKIAFRVFAIVATLLCVAASGWASETVLHPFSPAAEANGSVPLGILAMDAEGNLYGTTSAGGNFSGNCPGGYCGVVYELSPVVGGGWTESVLYTFQGNSDGGGPEAGVILDSAGNLYGTTVFGGDLNCSNLGCGTVYELVKGAGGTWTEKILYAFTGQSDGGNPEAGLVFDSTGNLYGTTAAWGDLAGCAGNGCGSVFKLSPAAGGAWTETTLHTFSHDAKTDGEVSYAALSIDAHGDLFGTTAYGGAGDYCDNGCGTVFELLAASGGTFHYAVIHQFGLTQTAGQLPTGGVTLSGGKIYGTTQYGGPAGAGTVWELAGSATGFTYTTLYNFQGGTDGIFPTSTMLLSSRGELYGETDNGGNTRACNEGCGTIFKLVQSGTTWTETQVVRFNQANGQQPQTSGLIRDGSGNLYGVTALGGASGDGVVFEVTP